eukprot:CAMPEP_0194508488 /NCGR_PEP_ID=MMETSP0253-20130528/38734_1 /TAXON_ID=2966 /ORGANISM="Noctiluca scintillans" /LENGTH=235 /DNA_ID=CAMNT_0039351531 /DNA_START=12 /DNA_END=719 /DNA_ORIENTATION=+
MNATKRIQNEVANMEADAVPGIRAFPSPKDLFRWTAHIDGPEGSPYEGGRFVLDVNLPLRYPLLPPLVRFKTPIFHPNVNESGDICLDIFKAAWSPALSLQKVLLSVSSLLADPNFADPLNLEAADLFDSDRKRYLAKCKRMTQQLAMTERTLAPGRPKAKAGRPKAKARLTSQARPKAKVKAKAKPKARPKTHVRAKAQAKSKAAAKAKASIRTASAKVRAAGKPAARATSSRR